MNIDFAYRLVNSIVNKDQRGYVKPSDFNMWAVVAQIEAISDRLSNVKRLGDRFVPSYGWKVDQKVKNELRKLLVGPILLNTNPSTGQVSYPGDYFYLDSVYTTTYVIIRVVDTDEYPRVKSSAIYPPTASYPVIIFYGNFIQVDPKDTVVFWTYLRYPDNPNWDYNMSSGLPVYNSSNTPGQTGSISQDFEVDQSMHIEIVWRICKYAGINIDMSTVLGLAISQENAGV